MWKNSRRLANLRRHNRYNVAVFCKSLVIKIRIRTYVFKNTNNKVRPIFEPITISRT